MNKLLIYGSEDCMGWPHVEDLIEKIEANYSDQVNVEVKDPVDHWEEFKEKGLTICPSFLFNDELVAVGKMTIQEVEKKLEIKK